MAILSVSRPLSFSGISGTNCFDFLEVLLIRHPAPMTLSLEGVSGSTAGRALESHRCTMRFRVPVPVHAHCISSFPPEGRKSPEIPPVSKILLV